VLKVNAELLYFLVSSVSANCHKYCIVLGIGVIGITSALYTYFHFSNFLSKEFLGVVNCTISVATMSVQKRQLQSWARQVTKTSRTGVPMKNPSYANAIYLVTLNNRTNENLTRTAYAVCTDRVHLTRRTY